MGVTTIIMAVGAVTMTIGVLLMIFSPTQGANRIKFFGQEAEVSTPALIVFIVGAALLVVPLVMPADGTGTDTRGVSGNDVAASSVADDTDMAGARQAAGNQAAPATTDDATPPSQPAPSRATYAKSTGGAFREEADGWSETNAADVTEYSFVQMSDAADAVTLYDGSRGMLVRFPVAGGQVEWSFLYPGWTPLNLSVVAASAVRYDKPVGTFLRDGDRWTESDGTRTIFTFIATAGDAGWVTMYDPSRKAVLRFPESGGAVSWSFAHPAWRDLPFTVGARR